MVIYRSEVLEARSEDEGQNTVHFGMVKLPVG